MKKALFLLTVICFCCAKTVFAQPTISYEPYVSGFSNPVDIAHAGDDRLFVAERKGIIKVIVGNAVQATPFLNISDKTSTERDRGLLSIAFHPKYRDNGFFYVYYTEKTSDSPSSGAITVARYKVSADNPNVADPASGLVLLSVLKPVGKDGTTFQDHNGGDLNFGADGKLYISTGDGGKEAFMEAPADPFNNAQNKESLLGKLLRLDVNSLKGRTTSVKPEIVAVGLRNPWRWSFDSATGDVWIGDVGHYKREEIDFLANTSRQRNRLSYKAGVNFGWRCYEGTVAYNLEGCDVPETYEFPIYEYINNRSTGGSPASVTGGYVYRGSRYPALYGYYIASDLYSGEIHLIKAHENGGWVTHQQPGMNWMVSYGQGHDGELYAIGFLSGVIYRVTAEGSAVVTQQSASSITDLGEENSNESLLSDIRVYPTVVQHSQLTISSSEPLHDLKIYNSTGNLRFNQRLHAVTGKTVVTLPKLAPGLYYILVTGKESTKKERLIIQ